MKNSSLIILATLSIIFLTINIYGLFQDIRSPYLTNGTKHRTNELRFSNDLVFNAEEALIQLKPLKNESSYDFAKRTNNVVQQSLAHIQWHDIADTKKYRQLIPIWENYFLYFMGVFSSIPEYEKYHYADYKRSIKRGIGICGDASMVYSQVLGINNIPTEIISFPGHVIVKAEINNREFLFDPDFGVTLEIPLAKIADKLPLIRKKYEQKGYSSVEIKNLLKSYSLPYQQWRDTKHFITKKYYFEYLSYILKWMLPILILIITLRLYKNKH